MATETSSLDTIFCAAIDIASPEQRTDYIAQACGDNPDLRARVEKLVAAHLRAGAFLEARPAPFPPPSLGGRGDGGEESGDLVVATVDEPPITEHPGTVIGPYKLLEQIGEGGFGVVFMAEQQEPIRRKVALKVLKPGMDTWQVIARFEAERQALALMDHPNVAKVLDAGQTSSARPYFVMELVKGVAITEFCDQKQLPIRERLELFLQVCQAVQHAHQKGIIHRDIKPSNILVTLHDGTPVPKIIDFGIAKALGQQLTERTLCTGFAQLIGTPMYMSPEQAELSGLDVDTRSDIYSLGVLLYELLIGTTPFDKERLKQAGYDEMRRIIREEEPPKPSTRLAHSTQTLPSISAQRHTEPAKLTKLVRGELDWIVMKCLEKDRGRRYETANSLALDIQHYLHSEPVQACPSSPWYRFRKFSRRHRLGLTMAGVTTATLILLVIGLSAAVVLVGRANTQMQEQRDRADKNFHQALRAVDDYLTQVSENRLLKSPVPGLQPLRKELLETALKYYQAFVEEHPDEPAVRSELARAYFRVGSIQEEIATKAEAVQAYQSSRALWERLVHDHPANSGFQQQLAECLRRIGRLQSTFLGQPGEGLQALEHAEALYEQLALAEPENLEFKSGRARTFDDLARWSADRGQGADEELQFHRQALEIWQWLAETDPRFRSQLGTTAMNLGYYYTRADKPSEALDSFDHARKIFVKLSDDNPKDTALLGELRRVYINIGFVNECLLSRYQDALRAYDRSRQILEQLTHDNPAVTQFQTLKGGIYKQIGAVLLEMKHFDEAEDHFRQAVAILDKAIEADPGNAQAQYFRADSYGRLGEAQLHLDHWQEALTSSDKSQAILEELLRRDPNQIDYAIERSRCFELAACVYRKTGRWDQAIQSYRRAIQLLEKVQNSLQQNRRVVCSFISFYAGLGDVQRAAGQRVQAECTYRQALDLGNKYLVDNQTCRAPECFYPACVSLGQLQIDSGKRAEARRTLQDARSRMEKLPQPNGEDLYNLACVHAQLSRLAGSGQAPLTAPEQAECRQSLDQAQDALRKAIDAGYRDLGELKSDISLDPLRDRDEFRKLLAGLETEKEKKKGMK